MNSWIKRIAMAAPPWVKKYPYNDHPGSDAGAIIMLEQLNPPTNYVVPCNRIQAIHKVIAYGPATKVGGSVRSDQLIPVGKGVTAQEGGKQ
jgi:hypothetical protein